jgi:hypothetical protein
LDCTGEAVHDCQENLHALRFTRRVFAGNQFSPCMSNRVTPMEKLQPLRNFFDLCGRTPPACVG